MDTLQSGTDILTNYLFLNADQDIFIAILLPSNAALIQNDINCQVLCRILICKFKELLSTIQGLK